MEEQKKYFEQRFDFNNYSVILRNNSIVFEYKEKFKEEESGDNYERTVMFPLPYDLENEYREEDGRVTIHYIDIWGSEMKFVCFEGAHYLLKGMFDFIARGYEIKLPEEKINVDKNIPEIILK